MNGVLGLNGNCRERKIVFLFEMRIVSFNSFNNKKRLIRIYETNKRRCEKSDNSGFKYLATVILLVIVKAGFSAVKNAEIFLEKTT